LNHFLAALIIIFLPGIITAIICDKISFHSKWGTFKFGLYAFILGVISYLIVQLGYYLIDILYFFSSSKTDLTWTHLKTWGALASDNPNIISPEIIFAFFVAIPLAYLTTYIITYKVLNRIAKFLGVSIKYGDENLFSFYLNAKEIEWVYVRDIKNNLTYEGKIRAYSETDSIQEVVLDDVKVFRYEDSAELYSLPSIYLSKPIGKFIIEAVPQNLLESHKKGEENG